MLLPSFDKFKEIFFRECPMFRKNFDDLESKFFDSWKEEFNLHLEHLFHEMKNHMLTRQRGIQDLL